VILQLAGFHHRFVFAGLVEFQLFHGYPSSEYHGIHGELVGPEVRVEEVNRKYETDREQCLVAMDDRGHVDGPARNDVCEPFRPPQDQPCATDYGYTPGYCEVVELLPIGVTTVIGAGTPAEEPFDGLDELLEVTAVEDDGVRSGNDLEPGLPRGLLATNHILQVHNEDGDQLGRSPVPRTYTRTSMPFPSAPT